MHPKKRSSNAQGIPVMPLCACSNTHLHHRQRDAQTIVQALTQAAAYAVATGQGTGSGTDYTLRALM